MLGANLNVLNKILLGLLVFAGLVTCGICASSLPADGAAGESSFIVDSWNTGDGLPQSTVITIVQTHDGYLWLGTLNGLVRFDGSTFTRFNVNNTPELPGNRIVFLFEDSATNLWVGTDNAGLCLVKDGLLQKIDTAFAGGQNIINAFEDKDHAIWFGTDQQNFFCWQDGVIGRPPYPELRKFLTYRAFHLFIPGANGANWQLQRGRVEKWLGDTLQSDYGPCPWSNSIVTAACEDHEGNLLVGTRGAGVYWFDAGGVCHHLTTSDGLSQNFILSLYPDHEGDIWVGTDTGGLDRLRKNTFTSPPELAAGAALSVSEDAHGGLWTTFNLRGLTYFQTNAVQHLGIGHNSRPWSVLVAADQRVWAGTAGEGLFQFTNGSFQSVAGPAGLGAQVFALFQSRDGKIWVGAQNGLGCYDHGNWSFYDQRNGLPIGGVHALAEDDRGNLWLVAEGGGLYTLLGNKCFAAEVPVKDVSCLLAGRNGVLWAGSSGHGLAWMVDGRWQRCSSFNGLAADDIGYLVEDEATNLWIGTYEGLMRVEEKTLFEATADPAKKVSCRFFLTRECSTGAQPAAIRTHDGRLWFPTTKGVASLDPAELRQNPRPPTVVIEAVAVDGVPQKKNPLSSGWTGSVTLKPGAEQLEIHFTSLNFSAPKNARSGARFKWRLQPRDKNPTEVDGGERVVHFNRLSPGSYQFQVIACNEDGVWNNAGAVLEIVVRPPFWQTRSFILFVTLTVLGLLAGAIYLASTAKLKRQLRQLHQKELIEKERARIARDLHDQIGANLTQVTLLGEMAEMDKELPVEIEQHAQQICATARETTRSLDEIVWAVNPSNDTLEGLANYACKYAQDYFALAGISFRAELPTQLPPIPILPEVRHNVFLAYKEAVNNVVKHAQATEARVKLQLEAECFILSVTDNGRGAGDVARKTLRNGLKNMRRRLQDVAGEFAIGPGPNGGTVVQLTVPVARLPQSPAARK